MNLATRMAEIAPFHVMELMAKAKALEAAGRSIIHMEVGEPDFPTPEPIVAAASAFIRTGRVFYTHALGLPQLRAAIARFYSERYGVLDRTRLAALWQAVASRCGVMLVDEIYHGLTYDCRAETALSISEDIFVINSFSKYFNSGKHPWAGFRHQRTRTPFALCLHRLARSIGRRLGASGAVFRLAPALKKWRRPVSRHRA